MIKLELNEEEKKEARRIRPLKLKAEELSELIQKINSEIMEEQIKLTKEINLRLSHKVEKGSMTMVDLDNEVFVAGSKEELTNFTKR